MIDVFKVGVHLGMTSNSGQVLSVMLRHLTGVEASQKRINENFKRMATLAAGAVSAFAGAAALRGIWSIVEASRKLNDELTRTKSLGGEFKATVAQARAVSFQTHYQVGVYTPSAVVRAQRELATQLPDQGAANALLPHMLKAAHIASQYTGEKPEEMIKNMSKVLDIRGQLFTQGPDGKSFIDPKKFMPEIEMMVKSLTLYGGFMNSQKLLQLATMAGVPAKTMSGPAFYSDLGESAAAGSPSRVGTGLTSLFSQLVGGTMPLHVAVEMQRMGMMGPGEWHREAGKVVIGPEATRRFQEAMKNPIEYITGPLNDMMSGRGMNDQEKLLEVFRLFGRQTTQRLVAEALSSEPQYARSRGIFNNIPGLDERWDLLQRENLTHNITAFTAAWQGLMEALGEAGIPTAITILQSLTGALHELTKTVEAHPNIAAGLLGVAGGLAAMAVLGGTITVLSAGLSALGAAFGAFGAGGVAAGALAVLTGPGGLIALALGIEMLGAKLNILPPWLIHMASGAAAGAGVGGMVGGAPGAVIGGVLGGVGGAIGSGTDLGATGLPNLNDRLRDANQSSYFNRFNRRPAPPAQAPDPHPIAPGDLMNRMSYGGNMDGRIAGDVYLDGNKVGQWLTRWMAGQVQRPAAGPTGVDTRMTFVAPGGAFA